jgi:N-acetyl-gamma-glutamyl-phosphate reductase
MTSTIFIDGEAGTTGLQIRDKLAGFAGIALRSLPAELRKDPAAKLRLYAEVDLVILCLPDEAAKETAKAIEAMGAKAPRVIDASSAHRVAPGWVYGFPGARGGAGRGDRQRAQGHQSGLPCDRRDRASRAADRRGLIAKDAAISINSVSGYSGGGKAMIEAFESGRAPSFELYGLALQHKHLPEIERYSGLSAKPIFVPSVGNFRQGMIVSVPLHLDALPGKPRAADLRAALAAHYKGAQYVKVASAEETAAAARLEPESLNGTNDMLIHVYDNEARRQAVLAAKFDNLGKGASGAAVQNLQLMLGL